MSGSHPGEEPRSFPASGEAGFLAAHLNPVPNQSHLTPSQVVLIAARGSTAAASRAGR
jgi:hypothetical protein